MSTTADHLQVLGMTEWESRAYLALLKESPATGYSVAKRSGVPRAKVYEVLSSLERKDAVHVTRGESLQYGPVPPGELIERMRVQTTERLDAAEVAIAEYAVQTDNNAAIWDIQGRQQILSRARRLIEGAQRRILMEIWESDADELRADLDAASAREVEIIVVAYGDPGYPFAQVYPHPLLDEVTGGRWLVLSVDDREVIAGIVSSGDRSRAALTTHPGLVVPVTELVRQDLYKLEILAAYGDVLESKFGPGLSKLREMFGACAQHPDVP
ncbi:TrmB family transcriptional regulator [Amycolatopsis sp.]|uniref:TrmB family transcriptional regulator n=1 Tax=Amycolatopsis sp. TaxID=37632 RepID=UPI002E02A82A|nr:TrmB family transcriptional regulator [Amycolatopsis sp.]